MKRFLIVLLVIGAIAVAGGVYVWQTISGEGGSDIEQWIARMIVRVLDNYITPEIQLGELDYEGPYKVSIATLKLTDEGKAILAVDAASLELGERPQRGEPIKIREIVLDKPALQFLQNPEGEFIGWSGFVEPGVASEPESVEEGQRLSDVLVLRHVGIHEGEIVYQAADGQTMRLPGINIELETPPVEGEPGWYKLICRLVRDPGVKLDFDGRINIDDAILEFDKVTLTAALGPDVYETIPPPLQGILTQHEVKGELAVTLTGRCPLMDPMAAEIEIDLTLTDSRIAFGSNVFPAERVHVVARVADGHANITYQGDLLAGSIAGDASIPLAEPMNMVLNWRMDGIRIEETLRVTQEGAPQYAGLLSGEGRVTANLADFQKTLGGQGRLTLREGRLARFPVIATILDVVEATKLAGDVANRDEADVAFTLHPEHVTLTSVEVKSGPAVLRGAGDIRYEGTLDMEMQVGVVEGLTDRLGELGKILRTVNDQLVSYDVTGDISNPTVKPKPLNIKLP